MKQRTTAIITSAVLVLGLAVSHIPTLSAKEKKFTSEKSPLLLAMGRRSDGTGTQNQGYGSESSKQTGPNGMATGAPQTRPENMGTDADSTGGAPQQGLNRSSATIDRGRMNDATGSTREKTGRDTSNP